MGAVLATLPTAPAPAGAASTTASASTSTAPPLTLMSQTSWVTPGSSFDLELRTAAPTVPSARLGLSVSVYSCLSTISGFDQSVTSAGGPGGQPISATQTPLALHGLPSRQAGSVDLDMPVMVGQSGATPSSGAFVIQLSASRGQCGAYPSGVYPVRVQLVDTSGGAVLGSITTHLVYTSSTVAPQRLRVALILPVQAAVTAAHSPTLSELTARPSAALAPLSAAALAGVSGVVASAARHTAVPVTLEAAGQTLAALSGPAQRATVAQLDQMTEAPSTYQFASSPFVPVNAAALVDAGLATELGLQIARSVQVMDAVITHAASIRQPAPDLGPWITNDTLDTGTLTVLDGYGYHQVVLPASAVTTAPTNGSTAEPFALTTARGSTVDALASNSDLAARFTGSPGDPVLAAHQLVAELAQMYFEKPNSIVPRGVAVVAPTGWSADPSFVEALLDALDANPIIEPVTTSGLFAAIPAASGCRPGCRLAGAGADQGLPIAAIRTQRIRINDLAVAATGSRPLTTQLSDLVLAGQSEVLRPTEQAHILHNAGSAVDAQLSQVVIAGDRTITFTSQSGTIPVTMVANWPYPVDANLTVTSDKLLFTNGSTVFTQPVHLLPDGHVNTVDISVRTRVSGLFKVDITLHASDGGLELSRGEITVRSTATSIVGIALSLGAVAVLAVWWIRTSRKRRDQRKTDDHEAVVHGGEHS
jgi:hypothetical protein